MVALLALSLGAAARYPPEPVAVDTGRLKVGAIFCPLWADGARWRTIVPFPEREPLLGWYDEGDPEVTDWEISWAVSHGISFFFVCWYRSGDGPADAVRPALGEWLHDGLFRARYRDRFQFAILFENGNQHFRGQTDERDLLENLLPYWIETYFRRPEYLRVDGRPILGIYNVPRLIDDLGGEARAAVVLEAMRERCRDAGLGGLTLLGQYCWGRPPELARQAEQIERVGFEASWSYHWPTFAGAFGTDQRPSSSAAIAAQEHLWTTLPRPNLLTLSMGWDSAPWGFSVSRTQWRLRPAEFEELCRRGKAVAEQREPDSLDGRLVLLDNWNEYGEGHWIMPTREHGFGYLDAVRRVFAPTAPEHRDVTPADLGLGPYDSRWRAWRDEQGAGEP